MLGRFEGLQAFGIAGMTRAMGPAEMERTLRPALVAMKACGALTYRAAHEPRQTATVTVPTPLGHERLERGDCFGESRAQSTRVTAHRSLPGRRDPVHHRQLELA